VLGREGLQYFSCTKGSNHKECRILKGKISRKITAISPTTNANMCPALCLIVFRSCTFWQLIATSSRVRHGDTPCDPNSMAGTDRRTGQKHKTIWKTEQKAQGCGSSGRVPAWQVKTLSWSSNSSYHQKRSQNQKKKIYLMNRNQYSESNLPDELQP
jgi:hypothetical protein